MTDGAVTFRGGGAYGSYDGIELSGDLDLSKITKPRSARLLRFLRRGAVTAGEAKSSLLFFQKQRAFLADQRLDRFGDFGEQPRQVNL